MHLHILFNTIPKVLPLFSAVPILLLAVEPICSVILSSNVNSGTLRLLGAAYQHPLLRIEERNSSPHAWTQFFMGPVFRHILPQTLPREGWHFDLQVELRILIVFSRPSSTVFSSLWAATAFSLLFHFLAQPMIGWWRRRQRPSCRETAGHKLLLIVEDILSSITGSSLCTAAVQW